MPDLPATAIWFPNAETLDAKIEQIDDGDIEVNVDGVVTFVNVFRGRYNWLKAHLPAIRSVHPEGLYQSRVTSISLKREPPDLGLLTVQYTGTVALPLPTYELVASQHEVPITYHPNFEEWEQYVLPSRVEDPEAPGTFIKTFEKFREFGANNDFRGIEAYWLAAAVWRKTSYSYTADTTITGLFKLGAPETGGIALPDASNTNRSWLKGDKTSRNVYRGASPIWETQETWLYNPNGWRSEIYG